MVAISEAATYTPSITRVETTDVALGGNEVNVPNKQFKEITDRTAYLKAEIDALKGDATAQATTAEFTQVGVASINQGRLSLVDNDPVGQAAGASTLYFAPYNGDYIAIYDTGNSRWELRQFTQRSLDIGSLAANTNYDIFAHWDGDSVELSAVVWANSGYGTSSRAVSLSRLNGIWINGSNSRRYLGTIRMTSVAGQCETSSINQFVWNAANRISREMYVTQAVPYTFGAASWRYANNSTTAARVNLVVGLDNESTANVVARLGLAFNARGISVAIGQNSTSPLNPVAAQPAPADAAGSVEIARNISIPAGANFYNAIEFADFVSDLRNPAVLVEGKF